MDKDVVRGYCFLASLAGYSMLIWQLGWLPAIGVSFVHLSVGLFSILQDREDTRFYN